MPRKPHCILPGLPQHALQRGDNRGVIFHNQADKDYFFNENATENQKLLLQLRTVTQ